MITKIKYKDLPKRIRQTYREDELTKCLEQGSRIRIVITKWGYRHVWRLIENEWHWVKSTPKDWSK